MLKETKRKRLLADRRALLLPIAYGGLGIEADNRSSLFRIWRQGDRRSRLDQNRKKRVHRANLHWKAE